MNINKWFCIVGMGIIFAGIPMAFFLPPKYLTISIPLAFFIILTAYITDPEK